MSEKAKKILLSELLCDCSKTTKIAYISVMTAMLVVCNMFFEFKFADVQFSLTIFFSCITGCLIGPIYGFIACFLGDLVGFLYNSGGFMYMPWVGIAMGTTALISGLVMNCISFNSKGVTFIKLAIVSVLTFLICTVAINTTAFWLFYNTKKVPFFAYLVTRLFVQGQIWNSIVNYALLFLVFPTFMQLQKQIQIKRK